jgi:N-acetyl-anhydromuramyl-L-alanine amidase AmpD
MDVFGPPTIGPALFGAVLSAASSPVLAERPARAYYDLIVSYGIDPAFLLAVMKAEHTYATNPAAVIIRYGIKNWGDTRTRRHASIGGKSIATDRGNFWAYDSWLASLDDLCYRLSDQTYAYKGLRTVETIIPTMAPDGDMDNNSAAYVRGVLAQMAAWQAQDKAASAAKGGKVALSKPTVTSRPSPNRNGYGSPHDPKAISLHITAGSGASALSWLTSPASQASANYVNMEDGTLYELVPPTESAWANGAVNNPNMANPIVAATLNAGRNMNTATISIENAGQTSGGKGGSLSDAQVRSLIALCAWLCQRFGIPADRDHIIPHAYVDSVNRPYCPGFSAAEWASWVGRIAALVKGGAVDQSQQIAGAVTPARPDGYMTPGQADTFTWPDGEGVIVYRKVRYFNPQEKAYYERSWSNDGGFTPWLKVA